MIEPKHEQLKRLLDYWMEKKGDRPAPIRTDIDPAEIKPILPHVGIVSIERPGPRFRYRLAGTEIIRGYGLELTGRYLDEMDLNDHQSEITREYARAAEDGEPSCSTWQYTRKDGRTLHYERLVLPMSSNGTKIDMLLGGCVFDWAYDGKN